MSFKGFINGKLRTAPLATRSFRQWEARRINSNIVRTARELRPDLVINNCPGLDIETVEELRKNSGSLVFWAGDDPELFPNLMATLSCYDFFFAASKAWIKGEVETARNGSNFYLPYGCAPDVFRPVELSKDERARFGSAVAFVGARYSDRELLLDGVREFELAIWGWKKDNPVRRAYRKMRGRRQSQFHQKYSTDAELYLGELNRLIRSGPITNTEANRVYNASDIVLNLQHPQIISAVNPKTFEISAAGAFQLLQHDGDLLGLYEKDTEIVCFENAGELKEKIAYFLENENERLAIAARAMKRTLGEHTFTHRMKKILTLIQS